MKKFKHPRDIKVGVIGYGGAFNMGKSHLREMKRAGMTPFAVCELNPKRLEVAQQDFPGIETYSTLKAMLKESAVNLLVHITPHNLHYPLATQCIKAGKHVVTEKPFVLTTQEADKLIAQSKQQKVMVSTYHNRHWDGWILRSMREVVEKKTIGDIYKVEAHMGTYGMPQDWWRTSRSVSGGILYDWGVHLLEYALQVIPSEVTEVSGFGHEGHWAAKMKPTQPWKKDCIEDDAAAIVRFKNGAYINLSVSQLESAPRPDFISFHGTKGYYGIAWDKWTTRTPNRKGELVEKTGKHPKDKSHLYYQNIADHLTGQAKLIITPQWARRPIHILDLAIKSAKQGKTLKAKYS